MSFRILYPGCILQKLSKPLFSQRVVDTAVRQLSVVCQRHISVAVRLTSNGVVCRLICLSNHGGSVSAVTSSSLSVQRQQPHIRVPNRTFNTAAGKNYARHYYRVLGISEDATQGQIKAAYYQMSKIHHPDVSTSPNSQAKFTEISQAYEILGDVNKRRMYDKGLGQQANRRRSPQSAGYSEEFTSEDMDQSQASHTHHRDASKFDEFYHQHYNEIRTRRKREYAEYQKRKAAQDAEAGSLKQNTFQKAIINLTSLVLLVYIVIRLSVS